MADLSETLKGILGDDAENKLGSVMGMLNGLGSAPQSESGGSAPSSSPQAALLSQAQSLIGAANDDRSRLLLSLKPYLNEKRKGTIDSAIKLLNLAQLSSLFKGVI